MYLSIRTSVCPSVCKSVQSTARRCCGFAAVGPAARRYRSFAARPVGRRSAAAAPQHGAQQQMRAVPRCQLTWEAEHRFFFQVKIGEVVFYARRYASTVLYSCGPSCVCVSLCPPVCLSQVIVVSKRLFESSSFLARRLPVTYPTLCCKEIRVFPKITVISYEICRKFWTSKILPRQVHRVVSKTRHRSNMLKTPTTVFD